MPKAYYNEIDKYCVAWLRNLIAEGLIADGDVDERSIGDVNPNDLRGYTQCHFFAGLGGWSGALRLASWPDHREVWTGSCPCQPFSLAGKQGGFADERHLWPFWRYLIAQRRPPVVYGEQVASAAQWLRLVRGDLEALDYAVGAIPIEAASAGADHLRDRYWFMGNTVDQRELQQEGVEREKRRWLSDASSSILVADADDARSQGRRLLSECADQRLAGPDGLADTNEPCEGEGRQQRGRQQRGRQQRGRQQRGLGGDQEARARDVPNATGEQARAAGQPRKHSGVEWVVGSDGKARRVKSGVRLLAHGIPNRVAKLRALGNAIDLRPAAAFIRATA